MLKEIMDVKCLEIFGGELIILYALGNYLATPSSFDDGMEFS